jgi:hypothetical protein
VPVCVITGLFGVDDTVMVFVIGAPLHGPLVWFIGVTVIVTVPGLEKTMLYWVSLTFDDTAPVITQL